VVGSVRVDVCEIVCIKADDDERDNTARKCERENVAYVVSGDASSGLISGYDDRHVILVLYHPYSVAHTHFAQMRRGVRFICGIFAAPPRYSKEQQLWAPAIGRYRLPTASNDAISRADVADFLVQQINDRALIGTTPLLIS
jgi:hypothetical protein